MDRPETELEDFFDLSIDLLCVVGFDGVFKRVNPALERTLGFPKGELLTRTALEITHPDDRERARDALATLADGNDLAGFEARVVCADGTVRWIEWNTQTRPERGVVYGVGRDTTERRRTETELQEARDQLGVLADEQAALRRLAMLVARGAPPADVFEAVAAELGQLLRVAATGLVRFEGDTAAVVAAWGRLREILAVGARLPLGGHNVVSEVARTGGPFRVDHDTASGPIAEQARRVDIRSSIGVPVLVGGRLWGVMVAAAMERRPLAPDTETRIGQFTELVATAIANAEARAEADRLAEQQATLRRVATLVAEGAAPAQVFDAVVAEVAKLSGAAYVSLQRADGPDAVVILSAIGHEPGLVTPGMRVALDGESAIGRVLRTGRSVRLEPYENREGRIAEIARKSNTSAAIGAPIVVDGSLWGVLIASWRQGDDPAPADAEARLNEFGELVATAIANADSRDQLAASRARVLSAADEARRRVVRDLHDGAQQRLVHTVVTLKLAQLELERETGGAAPLLADALEQAEQGNAALRELAHGILPAVLTGGGLPAAVDGLVSRLDLPVAVDVPDTRLEPGIEASAYFVVAEALTNVVKHARASRATVRAAVGDEALCVEISDDGVGGADAAGHGLVGLADRVEALGGTLRITSPDGGGTVVAATFPLS